MTNEEHHLVPQVAAVQRGVTLFASSKQAFAQIKHHFGARQLLLRSLKKVRIEWHWLMAAFNLRPLLTLIHPGPAPTPVSPGPLAPRGKGNPSPSGKPNQ